MERSAAHVSDAAQVRAQLTTHAVAIEAEAEAEAEADARAKANAKANLGQTSQGPAQGGSSADSSRADMRVLVERLARVDMETAHMETQDSGCVASWTPRLVS